MKKIHIPFEKMLGTCGKEREQTKFSSIDSEIDFL